MYIEKTYTNIIKDSMLYQIIIFSKYLNNFLKFFVLMSRSYNLIINIEDVKIQSA